MNNKKTLSIFYLFVILNFIFFGYLGLNYGHNSHETTILNPIIDSTNKNELIVNFFLYPHLLINLIILLNSLEILISSKVDIIWFIKILLSGDFFNYLKLNFKNENFIIFLRFFLLISVSLSSFFYFKLSKLLFKNIYLSILTAIIPLSSFTLLYHSRWMQPDLLVFIISPLIIYYFIKFYNKRKIKDLYLLSFFTGLSIVSKYTAGVFIFYPLIGSLISKKKTKNLFFSFLIIFLTIYIFMPAIVIRPTNFLEGILYEKNHYFNLGHAENTVSGVFSHSLLILKFLSLKLLSSSQIISFLIFCFCVFGFFVSFFKNKKLSFWILLPYLTYFIVFINTKIGFVRNYLFFFPLLIVYFNFCLDYLFRNVEKIKKNQIILTFFFCLILNSCFIFKNLPILDFKNYEKNIVNERSRFLSLDQIYPDAKLINEKLNSYLLMSKNKNKYFYLSNYTYKYLQKTKINHKNITTNIDAASHIIYVMGENDYILMANKLNSIDIVYGVHDYDVDFYPMQGGMTIKILSGAKENFATSN